MVKVKIKLRFIILLLIVKTQNIYKRPNTGYLQWIKTELWCCKNYQKTSSGGRDNLRTDGWSIYERDGNKSTVDKTLNNDYQKFWLYNELQNIPNEVFTPERPNAVWGSNITYIWAVDGFVYLTSIIDLFSRRIIAWTLSPPLEVSYVLDTSRKAKARRDTDFR